MISLQSKEKNLESMLFPAFCGTISPSFPPQISSHFSQFCDFMVRKPHPQPEGCSEDEEMMCVSALLLWGC